MKNTRRSVLLALVALLAIGFMVGCAGETETEYVDAPYSTDKFAAQVTYGTANHCGLAFVQEGTFDEAFIPNEWAKLSTDNVATPTTGDVMEFNANYRVGVTSTGGGTNYYYYPRFIVITLGGTTTLYEGKQIDSASLPTSNGEYTSGTGPIRYFKVSALTVAGGVITSVAEVSLANSFEGSLNDPLKAKAYIGTLRKFETKGTDNVDTSSFVKYVKEFASSTNTIAAALGTGATLLGTERLGFTISGTTASATSSANTIAIGAGANGIGTTGNAWAYASTFFKRNSAYSGNFNFTATIYPNVVAGDTRSGPNNALKSRFIVMQERLEPIANALIAAGKSASDVSKSDTAANVRFALKIDGVDVFTGASAANIVEYTQLFMLAK